MHRDTMTGAELVARIREMLEALPYGPQYVTDIMGDVLALKDHGDRAIELGRVLERIGGHDCHGCDAGSFARSALAARHKHGRGSQ